MSANCRAQAAKLREKYAKQFQIPLEDVEIDEWPNDEALVFSEKHPDLPKWSTGEAR